MTRLLVYGGRDYAERGYLFQRLNALHAERGVSVLIEGGATGADRLARRWALDHGIPVETYNAEWDNVTRTGAAIRFNRAGKPYDAAAGHVRNQKMIDIGRPDVAVGFPGGAGTADMTRRLEKTLIERIEG